MEALLVILYGALGVWLLRRLSFFKLEGIPSWGLPLVFGLKVLAGVGMYWLYTSYYPDRSTADIFKYFDDSKVMFDALFEQPGDYFKMLFGIANEGAHFDESYYQQMNHWFRKWERGIYNDSHTIIRFNALVRLFSFGFYNVHTVFMCFISLAGLTAIFKAIAPKIPGKEKVLGLFVFLFPSVLFWSSGVLKEGLLFFAFGFLILTIFNLIQNKKVSGMGLALIVLCLGLLMILKFYVLVVLIPVLVAYCWVELSGGKGIWWKYASVLLLFALVGLNMQLIFPRYDVLYQLAKKQEDFFRLAEAMESGSLVAVSQLEPTLWSFVSNIPQALSLTFLRPFIWETSSPFILMAAGENMIFLGLLAISLIFHRPWKSVNWNLVLLLFGFGVLLFLIIGWTTPVMGAIVRYKVPAWPMLCAALLCILDMDRILKMIKRSN